MACSALLTQTPPAPTGQSTSATLIGPGGGGGGGTTAGITLRCNILGASSTPLAVTGKTSHLGGDTSFNLPWNGKTTAPPKGRTVLQFDQVSIGTTTYQALPSNQILHYGNQSSCVVTFVPTSTSVGFISGLEITQGTQTSANSVPLQIGKKACLKIMGCGLNFSWANYTVDVTVNGQTTSFGLSDSVSPAVNNGAWATDPLSSAGNFAHELGHTSGRYHAPSIAPSGMTADNPDYSYPYQSGNSSAGAMATYFDSNGISDYAPSRGATGSPTEDPNQTHQSHEVMGYGGWTQSRGSSDYTFAGIRQYWGIWSIVPGGGITIGMAPAQTTASPYVLAPEHVRNAAAPIHPVPRHIQEALAMKDVKAAYEKIKHTLVAVQ